MTIPLQVHCHHVGWRLTAGYTDIQLLAASFILVCKNENLKSYVSFFLNRAQETNQNKQGRKGPSSVEAQKKGQEDDNGMDRLHGTGAV